MKMVTRNRQLNRNDDEVEVPLVQAFDRLEKFSSLSENNVPSYLYLELFGTNFKIVTLSGNIVEILRSVCKDLLRESD